MSIYIILCVVAGILSFVLLSTLTKKSNDVIYNKLDKAGKISNVVLAVFYLLISPLYIFLGLISYPNHEGFLGVLGWIIAVVCASPRGSESSNSIIIITIVDL